MATEIQPVPNITPDLPEFPGPNTPEATYDDTAYNWGSAIPGYGNRMKAIGDNVFNNANAAAAILGLVEDAQRLTELARDTAIGVANFKGDWGGLSGSLARPATVQHDNNVWVLMRDVANVAAEVPGESTAWKNLSANVSSVMGRTGDVAGLVEQQGPQFGPSSKMVDAPLGQWAQYGTVGNAPAEDWPTTANVAWWNVLTIGTSDRKTQRASQVFSGTQQGWVFERQLHDLVWSPWQRIFTGSTLIETGKYWSTPAAPAYSIDPSVATVNVIDVYNPITLNVSAPRGLGDQLTITLSMTASYSVAFSANVKPPEGGLPALTANRFWTLVLIARTDNKWALSVAGANPW